MNFRSLFLATAAAAAFLAGSAQAQIDSAYGPLLKKYVTPQGVKYGAWKANAADLAALEKVVDSIAKAPSSSAASKEQQAFHLNAYNAWILREKLREYPGNQRFSVLSVLPYFNKAERITVAGKKMSFNNLENDIIRPRYKDPRIHAALNCAARSCPPLLDEPFTASKLDRQLDGVVRRWVAMEVGGVKLSADKKSADVSKIFDWFKDDFAVAGGVVPFINKYRTEKLPADVKLNYQSYIWNLNEAK